MEINVIIDKGVVGHPPVGWLRRVAEKVLLAERASPAAEVGLLITGQERVRQLNRSYRGKDAATDVLSFSTAPAPEGELPAAFVTPPDGVVRLGDVIISHPQAEIQAEAHRHSVEEEMAILITHGVLHLLGYDHEKPEERRRMRAREKEILGMMRDGNLT